MKRILIAIFLITPMVISFLPSTQATGVIDLGTIAYKGSTTISINQSYDVDLINIYAPIPNSLTYRKFGFNPLTNQTTYVFMSGTIPVDYTFVNDTKAYLFQDITSNQVYRFNVDFKNISVPLNPYIILYNNLFLRLNSTLQNYTQTNASIIDLNASLLNMTNNYNSTYYQLQEMSLNASLAQTTVHQLYREKEGLENELFITRILIPLLVIFCSIIAVFLGKRFGWLNKGNDGRLRKKLDSGYGIVAKKYDEYIIRKNDEITKKRGGYTQVKEDGSIEKVPQNIIKEKQIPPKEETPPVKEKTPEKIEQKPQEIPFNEPGQEKEIPSSSQEEIPMLAQWEIISKALKQGSTAEEIFKTTGFNKQYINTIQKKIEGKK